MRSQTCRCAQLGGDMGQSRMMCWDPERWLALLDDSLRCSAMADNASPCGTMDAMRADGWSSRPMVGDAERCDV
jgi:hypothetical protein